MTHAIRVHEHGGPDTMRREAVEVPAPSAGEARVRHTAIGVNYIDVYFRTGLYTPPGLPFTPGMEAAGVVEAVGEGVTDIAVGDRVAYAAGPPGAYAEERVIAADRLVALPESISDEQAAGMMLKGLTAQYLLRRTYRVQPGDTVLVHAAAGGVGLIACQWAHHLGATVIGTVGSADKAALAQAHGCHYPVNYREEDFVERVREITGGAGVAAVYDSVGQDTFMGSLDCLRPMGTMASFGQSSGSVPPLDPGILAQKGSLFLTRPTLFTYMARREDLLASTAELFDVVARGAVRIEVNQRFALGDAAGAHRDLEARRTTGSTILLP
ncbi:quinone oxidoreductase [Arhodomonas aquaeolei]|uniref:quinone oxidoreductase family protein n=1 Tax=Arhodomonas aquaeolei TaxID=2369 RepID=UPI002167D9EE|nr:quinone oxidoreductase [Arhodomonas aquaeolei]MCS4505116.1 quinone oxidoreductase [Arhodomonas aquaeolei]